MVWNKLRGLKGEEFERTLKSLPQVEQDIYAKVIKGNEDWFNTLIKENMKNNDTEIPDLSAYSLTEGNMQYGDVSKLLSVVMAAPQNKDKSVDEIIEGLINQGLIKLN